jgi:predicted ATPase/DNA-binding SARP family transcriptional activator/class 3 adenylate cyclase
VHYSVLGPVSVTDADGADRTPGGERQRLLLATLLAHAGRVVSTDRLADQLWGDDLPANAAAALQNQVSRLRRLLADDATSPLVTGPEGYRLVVSGDELDAARFEALLATAETADHPGRRRALLEEALGLWRGRAYGEVADRPVLQAEATRLEELRAAAAEDRAQALLDEGRVAEAIAAGEELVASWPLRERPRALLMQTLYAGGRQTEALAVYRDYRELLADELGLEPSPSLAALEGRVLRHDFGAPVPAAPTAPAPPGGEVARPRRSLGPPATSFVGRERDLAGVLQRLGSCRLVTICGTGGVGKTRLALEAAARSAGRYPDGAPVLELAEVAPGDDVAAAIASTLGIPERAGTSVADRLAESLRDRRLLLVLDNCEHVLDEVAAVVEPLLRATDSVDVLATSRAALAVDGEQVWPLVPLEASGLEAPALRLFADRARAASPGITLDGDNRAVVERICERLDGLPLALELAAARLRVTGLSEVLEAVEGDVELLSGGRRTPEARHRSLEALVEWSYQLLSPDEQRLFARLSVFAGAFTTDDAVAVTADEELDAKRVPGLLWSLVEQSLVVHHDDPPAAARYSLLEMLRQAGRQRLEAEGCRLELERRHAGHVLRKAEEARTLAQGPEAASGVALVDRFLPELRSAFGYLRATDDLDTLLRLAYAVFWYGFHTINTEVLGWIEEAAERARSNEHPLVPAVLGSAATARWQQGDLVGARAIAEEGIAEAQRLGDPPGSFQPYEALGDVEMFEGNSLAARRCFDHARPRAAHFGLPVERVYVEVSEAMALAYGGDADAALPVADRALGIAEASGSPIALAWAAYSAGEVRLETDPEAAIGLLERALVASHAVGERMIIGVAGLSTVTLRARLGGRDHDLGAYRELIEHWRRVGAWTQQWTTLRNLVELLARRGEEERAAARLLGASEASGRAAPAYGAEAQRLERAVEALRWRLGPDLDTELAAGRQLGDEGAVALALAIVDRVARSDERVLRTILFTDVVASTEELERRGDAGWRALLDRHDELVRSSVSGAGGEVIASTGDGVMAAFVDPAAAVACALELVDRVQTLGIRIRAGLHTGECERRGDNLAGRSVHVAARVAAQAGAGEVLVTRTVKDLIAGAGHRYQARGRTTLRGLSDEWELFALEDVPAL